MSTTETSFTVNDCTRSVASLTHMDVRKYKAIKTVILGTLVVGFGAFAIYQGSDPTTTAWGVFLSVCAITSFELGEYFAALREIRDPNDRDDS